MSETTSELLRRAADRHGLTPDEIAKRIAKDTPKLDLKEARWLVDRFYNGGGTPVVVADGIIKIIADRNPATTTRR